MANFNVLADLSNLPLTRQDLFDAWSTAQLSAIEASDLADGFRSVTVAATLDDAPSAPTPGALLWVTDQQTMFCYHDEVDGTGVSLWLAIGPDVFETAALLAEPSWPGAVVEPYIDRYVAPVGYTDSILGDGVSRRMIGTVHSGVPYPLNTETPETLASGTWVRMGIDGFVFGWVPNASEVSESLFAITAQRAVCVAPVDAVRTPTRMKGGIISAVGVSGRVGAHHPYFGLCGFTLYTSFNGDSITGWGQHCRFRWTGFIDQADRTP